MEQLLAVPVGNTMSGVAQIQSITDLVTKRGIR